MRVLGQACRIFLRLAYPSGESGIPATKRAYLDISDEPDLEPLLKPPVCQVLPRLTCLGDPSFDPLPGSGKGQDEVSPYLLHKPRILRDACRATRQDDHGRRCPSCCVRILCDQQARDARRLPDAA